METGRGEGLQGAPTKSGGANGLKSRAENSEESCFGSEGWMARRDEGDGHARRRTTSLRESNLQGLGSPYLSWVFDQGATKSDGRQHENPLDGGSFVRGRRWLGLYSPLRGCSGLAAWPTAKIPRRRAPRNFQTGSNPSLF